MMRAAFERRSSGNIAWYTARAPKTLVSHTARISANDTLLGRVRAAQACSDMPAASPVRAMAALLTSRSRRPSSCSMRRAAVEMDSGEVTSSCTTRTSPDTV